MKLLLLTALTMVAFASNSLLNRLALAEAEIGPAGFALIRVISGAVVLLILVVLRSAPQDRWTRPNPVSVLALTAYLAGFSFAYVSLDAGIGALLLFGGVQITMFGGAIFAAEPISRLRWFGSLLAAGGLVWLLAPGQATAPVLASALMVLAAIGWGIFSLNGRKSTNPLGDMQTSFLLAVPLIALIWFTVPDTTPMTLTGVALAIASGGVASALGYVLWYAILPRLDTVIASTAQLTVPAIAMAGGALLLAEPVTFTALIAAGLILTGVLIAARS